MELVAVLTSLIVFLKSDLYKNHFPKYYLIISKKVAFANLWGCLVCDFKQPFSVFKQYFTYFNALFHSHLFLQIFLNNNFQFLNTHIKQNLIYTKRTTKKKKKSNSKQNFESDFNPEAKVISSSFPRLRNFLVF